MQTNEIDIIINRLREKTEEKPKQYTNTFQQKPEASLKHALLCMLDSGSKQVINENILNAPSK